MGGHRATFFGCARPALAKNYPHPDQRQEVNSARFGVDDCLIYNSIIHTSGLFLSGVW
jgi:hypothetical protein